MLRLTFAVALVVSSLAGTARAEIESDLVKQGIAAYNDLEYPHAVELLQKALQETLTREEKLITYQTLAFAHVALDKSEAAILDFENLLALDDNFELDRTISPRVRAVFEEAKARVATGQGVSGPTTEGQRQLGTLDLQLSPARAREGQSLDLRAAYPGGVAVKLEVFYRTRGAPVFARVTAASDGAGHFATTIPGMDVHAPGLEYYASVLDDSGVGVARAGTLAHPLELDVAGLPRKPVYKKGWFWGVIGGVAIVGAGVATAVALSTRSSVSPTTPAMVTISPQ